MQEQNKLCEGVIKPSEPGPHHGARTVNRESEVKASAAVRRWPSSTYTPKVSTLTRTGMVLSVKPKKAWMMKLFHSVPSSWLRTAWMRSHMDHCAHAQHTAGVIKLCT